MDSIKIEDVDLYELLGIHITATESEIKSSYRKKALKCHPDKNPDDPKAAETFHQLSKALEILTDVSAKAAYDRVLKAKAAAKLRHKELDSKRQKLKEDLERRERYAAFENASSPLTDEQKLAAEVIRLRKEGSQLLQEEQKRMREEILRSRRNLNEPYWDSSLNRIKIKWKADKNDPTNGGYDETTLQKILKKYGDIVTLIVSGKRNGSALVEFSSKEASDMAIQLEKGLPGNPITLKLINNEPIFKSKQEYGEPNLISDRDYESLVLRRMRQAAERQELIKEMMKEENK
ncbi:DnaJ homolog subfamily C member 17 [Eumeta japonica]|uniref:DnaJ homolog subfamily C member 17 n=1 Tax=Eumeta variegata TaxID=151549 RepID=A0A4C1VV85_EUMVA|nr:DnaJ homolog subfamily C member 17 [Eumeta japonica]